MADSANLQTKRQDLDAATAHKDGLTIRASELPSLVRQAVKELADQKRAYGEDPSGGKSNIRQARETLHELRDEADTLPYELLEAKRRVFTLTEQVFTAESEEAKAQVSAAWEEVQDYRDQREHFETLEGQAMGRATSLEGQSFERQRRAIEARQELAKLDQEEKALVQQEALDAGIEPRARPATRGREVVMDSLR